MKKRSHLAAATMYLVLFSPIYAQSPEPSTVTSQGTPVSQLIIYHAGSLTAAFKKIEAAFMVEHPDVKIVDKFGGSVTLARQITIGGEPADLYASADYEDIDVLLKPKWANYTIRFAQGGMVLVYKIDDPNPLAKVQEIAEPGILFNPNGRTPTIPNVAPDWYKVLSQPGVWIKGGDPGTDPGAYRGLLIMQLAEKYYRKPGLYNALDKNDTYRNGAETPAPAADYRFAYEHSALAMARADPNVRLARLPAEIAMSDSTKQSFYQQASLTIPGLSKDGPPVTIRGSRVVWGITILNSSKNRANDVAFLKFLLTTGKGPAIEQATGPDPIVPAIVSKDDYAEVPVALRTLVEVNPRP